MRLFCFLEPSLVHKLKKCAAVGRSYALKNARLQSHHSHCNTIISIRKKEPRIFTQYKMRAYDSFYSVGCGYIYDNIRGNILQLFFMYDNKRRKY